MHDSEILAMTPNYDISFQLDKKDDTTLSRTDLPSITSGLYRVFNNDVVDDVEGDWGWPWPWHVSASGRGGRAWRRYLGWQEGKTWWPGVRHRLREEDYMHFMKLSTRSTGGGCWWSFLRCWWSLSVWGGLRLISSPLAPMFWRGRLHNYGSTCCIITAGHFVKGEGMCTPLPPLCLLHPRMPLTCSYASYTLVCLLQPRMPLYTLVCLLHPRMPLTTSYASLHPRMPLTPSYASFTPRVSLSGLYSPLVYVSCKRTVMHVVSQYYGG